MNYLDLFHILAPQIGLTVLAFAILAIDLFGMRRQSVETRSKWLGAGTAVGIVVASLALASRIGDVPDHARTIFLNGTLVVDDLGLFFQVVVLALTLLTVLISMGADFTEHVGEYYALLIFGALGMMFLITSEELIILFASLELLSLCLYILTAFHKSDRRSTEAGIKYYVFGALSSAFLLFGLSYLYGLTGQTSLSGIANGLSTLTLDSPTKAILLMSIVFIVVGFGFKIAVVPFHLWAPDAYQGAPTPVTAFIATGSKVASFVVLIKVMLIALPSEALQGSALWHPLGGATAFHAGWVSLLVVVAALSMVLGNVAAIVQSNVKRLLAYSSIAHGGYVLLGVLAANEAGAQSVLFYVIVYGMANVGAFGVVQALAGKAGGDDFEHFRGMARRSPFLSFMMLIFVLSLAGIPPLGGFFGKFYLFFAAAEVSSLGMLWLVILAVAMSAVSLYYYLLLLKQMYVIDPVDSTPIRAPYPFQIATAAAALVVVILGVFPGPVLKLIGSLFAHSSLVASM